MCGAKSAKLGERSGEVSLLDGSPNNSEQPRTMVRRRVRARGRTERDPEKLQGIIGEGLTVGWERVPSRQPRQARGPCTVQGRVACEFRFKHEAKARKIGRTPEILRSHRSERSE